MSDTLPPDLRDLLIRIDARLGTLVADVAELKAETRKTREEMAFMRGRLESIPTVWQTATLVFSVLVGLPVVASIAVYVLHLIGKL